MSYIEINDIFDELSDENKRLKQCLNVFIKFKSFFDSVFDKLKTDLDSNDSQNFQRLGKEIDDNLKCIYYQSFDDIRHNFKLKTKIKFKSFKDLNQSNSVNISSKKSSNQLIDNKSTINLKTNKRKRNIKENLIKSEDPFNQTLDLINQNMTPNKSVKPFRNHYKLSPQKTNTNLDESQGFSCTFIGCGKILKTKDILRTHLKRHTISLQFRCDFNGSGCGYSTHSRVAFSDHMNAHKGIRAHGCEYCNKSFYSKDSLNKHIKLVHHYSPQILICDFDNCNKQFKTELSFKNHQKYQHLTERKFICEEPNCGMRAVSAGHLRKHYMWVHSKERPFKCQVEGCLKAFKAISQLNNHINSHSTERNYKCEVKGCNKAFKNHQDLRIHTIIHSDIEFKCEWPGCEYTSKTKGGLNTHQSVHSSERSFVCEWPQCGKRYKTKAILESHLRIHNNDKRYVCSWPGCQYRCTDSGNLAKHKRIHIKK